MKYTEREYKPIRVFRNFDVTGSDHHLMQKQYPNGIFSIKEGVTHISYTARSVINIPTDFERDLFKNPKNGMEIPQHQLGFDIPTSGIARSRKSSHRGKTKWERWCRSDPFTFDVIDNSSERDTRSIREVT